MTEWPRSIYIPLMKYSWNDDNDFDNDSKFQQRIDHRPLWSTKKNKKSACWCDAFGSRAAWNDQRQWQKDLWFRIQKVQRWYSDWILKFFWSCCWFGFAAVAAGLERWDAGFFTNGWEMDGDLDIGRRPCDFCHKWSQHDAGWRGSMKKLPGCPKQFCSSRLEHGKHRAQSKLNLQNCRFRQGHLMLQAKVDDLLDQVGLPCCPVAVINAVGAPMFDWNTKVLFCRSTTSTIEKTKKIIAILWGANFSTVAASKTNGSWIAYIHCRRLWLHVTEKWAPCLERRHAFFQCLMVDANGEDRLECSMLYCDDWWKIV